VFLTAEQVETLTKRLDDLHRSAVDRP